MKLSNATIYRSIFAMPLGLEAVEAAMRTQEFIPTAGTQERSVGWVPPREKGGPLVESVGGHWIAKLMIETRSVPAPAVRRRVDERAAEIEKLTGRKPGKQERKDLKEDITHELMPHAFPKQSAVGVWISPQGRLIVVDTSSQGRADEVVTSLVRTCEGLALTLLNTAEGPSTAMARWLSDADAVPAGFTVDRDAELRATDESKARIRYANHPLDTDEVRAHIASGMRPANLAMTWEDRVSFVLTDSLTLRALSFLEGTAQASNENAVDDFDANVAITTGEGALLIAALLSALGGEPQLALPE